MFASGDRESCLVAIESRCGTCHQPRGLMIPAMVMELKTITVSVRPPCSQASQAARSPSVAIVLLNVVYELRWTTQPSANRSRSRLGRKAIGDASRRRRSRTVPQKSARARAPDAACTERHGRRCRQPLVFSFSARVGGGPRLRPLVESWLVPMGYATVARPNGAPCLPIADYAPVLRC